MPRDMEMMLGRKQLEEDRRKADCVRRGLELEPTKKAAMPSFEHQISVAVIGPNFKMEFKGFDVSEITN